MRGTRRRAARYSRHGPVSRAGGRLPRWCGTACPGGMLERSGHHRGGTTAVDTARRCGTAHRRQFHGGCTESVSGDVGPDWRDHAVVSGPLSFVDLRHEATTLPLASPDDRTGIVKSLIVLEAGASVRLSPRTARSHARLMYTLESLGLGRPNAPLSVGTPDITLTACHDRDTQFNGGLIVDEPQCVPLEISIAGRPTERITVSLGAGTCPVGSRE